MLKQILQIQQIQPIHNKDKIENLHFKRSKVRSENIQKISLVIMLTNPNKKRVKE